MTGVLVNVWPDSVVLLYDSTVLKLHNAPLTGQNFLENELTQN